MEAPVEHDPTDPLSAAEIRHLRRIIVADARARWFWTTIRTFALWLTAVVVAVISTKNAILELFFGGKH